MATQVQTIDEDRAVLAEELAAIEAARAQRSLKAFAGLAWSTLEPGIPLLWNWHLDVLCDELERVTRGETENLLVNVPPGTMKSLLTSVIWPAWEWTTRPDLKYLCGSFHQDLATRDTMKMRNLVRAQWYQAAYDVKLRDDQEAKAWFINSAGGWRVATSTDGKGTGEHPDRKIVDDPHSAKQARSPAERRASVEWFKQTLSTRGAGRGAVTVVIMQRLHEEDLSGHILSVGGWRHVMLPMRFEPERADKRDPRTSPGELLWPALFPEAKVRTIELALGAYGVAGQLQQRPAPQGGGLFKREWFRTVDRLTTEYTDDDGVLQRVKPTRCRAWDVAATEDGGCFTAGVKVADCGPYVTPRFVVEDVRRGQWGPANVDQRMADTASTDGRTCRIREEQEGGSAGKTVVIRRARDLAGFDYHPVAATGDKEVRANAFRAQAEAGNVALLRAPWNEDFLQELESFPNGAFKDQVDAASHAFNDLLSGPRAARVVRSRW